jgi:hypothetical protein
VRQDISFDRDMTANKISQLANPGMAAMFQAMMERLRQAKTGRNQAALL